MAFTKNYITIKGLALAAKVLAGGKLQITRVVGGSGTEPSVPYSDMLALGAESFLFETPRGIVYEGVKPNQVLLPIYYATRSNPGAFTLSEIGVYAADPDEGEILLCVVPGYDAPLALPSNAEGYLEITLDLIIELLLAPDACIVLPSSLVFITRPEADALYAPKKHRHPADEIDESIGRTTEAHQRWQDEQLAIMRDRVEAGVTSNAIQIEFGPERPLKWRIVNHRGWYDKKLGCYRCGASEWYLPEETPPPEPTPGESTGGESGGTSGGGTGGGQKALGKR